MSSYDALERAVQKDLDVVLEAFPQQELFGTVSPTVAAAEALKSSLLKKREDWSNSEAKVQEEAALTEWLSCQSACASYSWPTDHPLASIALGEIRNFLHKLLVPQNEPDQVFGLGHMTEYLGPGPGAARLTDSKHFFAKMFASKASATSEYLYALYRSAISDQPSWAEAEFARHGVYGSEIVSGSSYFSVPKNRNIQRACATEPSVNMLLQKALGTYIEDRLKAVLGLSIREQPNNNRYLAFMGSKTGQFGTIDLRSASDRLSMTLMELVLPREILAWVKLFRSPQCCLPDGTVVNMEMCSSMGNGFTFPLQTALFAAVVACSYRLCDLPFGKLRQRRFQTWGVFGDDIVVLAKAYDTVVEILKLTGSVVNETKSFNSGLFRESCGEDWFHGFNIRGVYIRRLDSIPAVVSAFNRLQKWQETWGISLNTALDLLLGLLPKRFRTLYVPPHEDDQAGIKRALVDLPLGWFRKFPAKVRHNRHYGQWPYKAIVPYTRSDELPPDGEQFNPNGWFVSALGGYVRTPPYDLGSNPPSPRITIREKEGQIRRWKVKVRYSSRWGEDYTLPKEIQHLGGRDWLPRPPLFSVRDFPGRVKRS